MDVAVFVGFASTGPTHRPVAIESVREYAMVFGSDAPLAYDSESGKQVFAYLGAAVRAFFSNGGQRCWVIRVARTPELEALWRGVPKDKLKSADLTVANRFALPGVLVLSNREKSLLPAVVQARSVGSWSDGLRVQTALTVTAFELKGYELLTTTRISFHTTASLQIGDLIEFDDPLTSSTEKIRRYAVVDTAIVLIDTGNLLRQVEATPCAAFESVAKPDSPSVQGTVEITRVAPSQVLATLQSISKPKPHIEISFTMNNPLGLDLGQWIRWLGNGQIIWLQIEQLTSTLNQTDKNQIDVVVAGQAWREVPQDNLVFPTTITRAALLTLDLRVLAGQTEVAHIAGVGLTFKHRAAWWRQISDAIYYATSENQTKPRVQFPLAAMDEEIDKNSPLAWIPLGVSSLFGEALTPLPQTATALERDGLSRFNTELFLDPELDNLAVDHLIQQTDVIRFLSSVPRELFGIHAALSIGTGGMFNEASLIAIPDALHRGWEKKPPLDISPCKLKTPDWKDDIPSEVPLGEFRLKWQSSNANADFILEEALHVDFKDARKLYQGNKTSFDVVATHGGIFYYRVIDASDECSTASATLTVTVGSFFNCTTHKLNTPVWQDDIPRVVVPLGRLFQLKWQELEVNADFILEEALRVDFKDARKLYQGNKTSFDVTATHEGIFYYRVTAVAGDECSTASATRTITVRDHVWILQTPKEYEDKDSSMTELLRIHRAMLRLASASGELFAVMGLPRHYRAADAIRYVSRLRISRLTDSKGFDVNERRALSYGAIYHPWIISANAQQSYPPEGVATGVLAARATRRGAWIAPANELFKDVSALTPLIDSSAFQALQDAQINLVRADARGFLSLSADTLSDEPEWCPINVRRLFILLRRLALRRGISYVFEPNDDVLRRAVERGFTFLLTELFRRGAFAGATPVESFRVVTSTANNSTADRDAGRFFVELQVAPSLPLQFLTIRLSQSGERFTVLEEA
jgi:hypothetical protein